MNEMLKTLTLMIVLSFLRYVKPICRANHTL